jgi:hypothetical protein
MYLLRRIDQGGGYVTAAGSRNSYTRNPLKARRFATRQEAEANRCPDNEVAVDFHKLIGVK